MNLQQLEYIVAIDKHRHFVRAAKACFVTQATLSMMVQKLEDELGTKIFDRSKQPVVPTETGMKILAQARRTLAEAEKLKGIVEEERGIIAGEFRLGIIPTLAPYLLPLFLKEFSEAYPQVKLIVNEYTTANIIAMLKAAQLDAAILATPLNDVSIFEQPLFYEKYFLYVSAKEKGFDKQYVLPKNIDVSRLWLLEEGHCMRSQMMNLCELKKQQETKDTLQYEAGSIETLKNIVDRNFGITIIPELATTNLSAAQTKRLRYFKPPTPVREISIVTHREYLKLRLVDALKQTILAAIPSEMKSNKRVEVLDVEV